LSYINIILFLRSKTQKSNKILNFYFILFFLYKKFTVKLKVKNKTSKKFKKGISFVCVRLALVWGDGPGDPWVMGHGSRAQWVAWVMGYSE